MAAYRSSKHESTGYSPNLLTLGREARAPIDIVLGLPNAEEQQENYDTYVETLSDRMREAYSFVRKEIGRAAERNKKYYDVRVRPLKYKLGDWVHYYNPRRYKGRQEKWSRKCVNLLENWQEWMQLKRRARKKHCKYPSMME